jgi:uncharacterized protein with HEPN domain
MSKREPGLLLNDILESAERIIAYTSGYTFEQFLSDQKTIDAVIRNFGIIGEAASKLPNDFKDRLPHVEWNKIRGFRNRLVHDYAGVDYLIIWDTKNDLLPQLVVEIKNEQNKE